jgi:hypothetical protein
MVLIFLHLINSLTLAAAVTAYFRFPHLWQDQGVMFLTLVTTTTNSVTMLAIGFWALLTKSSGTGKIALHAVLALGLACTACYFAYRVGMDYHVIAYFRSKLF